jgi:Flp pilus assembly pilin Flp
VEGVMRAFAARLRALVGSDEGQDLIEYALLAALIVIAAIGAVGTVGNVISDVFWARISAQLNAL